MFKFLCLCSHSEDQFSSLVIVLWQKLDVPPFNSPAVQAADVETEEQESSDQDTPPTQQDSSTVDQDTPPTQQDSSTVDQDTPPTQQDSSTVDQDIPPTQQDSSTVDQDTPPTQQDIIDTTHITSHQRRGGRSITKVWSILNECLTLFGEWH